MDSVQEYFLFPRVQSQLIPRSFIASGQIVDFIVSHELRSCIPYQTTDSVGNLHTKHSEFVTVYTLVKVDKPNNLYGFSCLRDLSDTDKTYLTLVGIELIKEERLEHIEAITNAIKYGRADLDVYRS